MLLFHIYDLVITLCKSVSQEKQLRILSSFSIICCIDRLPFTVNRNNSTSVEFRS